MVRQEVDSEKLRALRAELEQETALLPAVLHTSNCVALVDHLTSIFKEADWHTAARCSQSLDDDVPAEPSGWGKFQTLLQEDTQSAEAQAELQAMDVALIEMQAHIQSIQQSTCLPPSRLAALASTSGRDGSGRLETVRCSVCHSLLLTAAFNDHLPSCRPCAPPSMAPARPTKSSTSHPSSNSRAANKVTAAKGGSKGKGKGPTGSKKPPAGPSRFAIEQAKPPPQPLIATKSSDDSDLQMPSNLLPHRLQPPAPFTYAPALSTSHPAHHVHPSGAMQQPGMGETQMGDRQMGERQKNAVEGRPDDMAWPKGVKRSRTAWAYEDHMSRSNPDMDAVHDPSLPPRFPQSATMARTRSKRSPSAGSSSGNHASIPSQTDGGAHLASGYPHLSRASGHLAGCAQAQQAERRLQQHREMPQTTQWQRQPVSSQDTVHDTRINLQQQQQQQHQFHGQQRQTLNRIAEPAGLDVHAAHPRQSSSEQMGRSHSVHSQSGQLAAQLPSLQGRLSMHHKSAAEPSHPQSQPAQLPLSYQSALRQQQASAAWQTAGYTDAAHSVPHSSVTKPRHVVHPPARFLNLAATQSMQPSASGAGGVSQQQQQASCITANGLQQQPYSMPVAWSSANGHGFVPGDDDMPGYRVAGPGTWRMPESKRQVSMNALARTSYGT